MGPTPRRTQSNANGNKTPAPTGTPATPGWFSALFSWSTPGTTPHDETNSAPSTLAVDTTSLAPTQQQQQQQQQGNYSPRVPHVQFSTNATPRTTSYTTNRTPPPTIPGGAAMAASSTPASASPPFYDAVAHSSGGDRNYDDGGGGSIPMTTATAMRNGEGAMFHNSTTRRNTTTNETNAASMTNYYATGAFVAASSAVGASSRPSSFASTEPLSSRGGLDWMTAGAGAGAGTGTGTENTASSNNATARISSGRTAGGHFSFSGANARQRLESSNNTTNNVARHNTPSATLRSGPSKKNTAQKKAQHVRYEYERQQQQHQHRKQPPTSSTARCDDRPTAVRRSDTAFSNRDRNCGRYRAGMFMPPPFVPREDPSVSHLQALLISLSKEEAEKKAMGQRQPERPAHFVHNNPRLTAPSRRVQPLIPMVSHLTMFTSTTTNVSTLATAATAATNGAPDPFTGQTNADTSHGQLQQHDDPGPEQPSLPENKNDADLDEIDEAEDSEVRTVYPQHPLMPWPLATLTRDSLPTVATPTTAATEAIISALCSWPDFDTVPINAECESYSAADLEKDQEILDKIARNRQPVIIHSVENDENNGSGENNGEGDVTIKAGGEVLKEGWANIFQDQESKIKCKSCGVLFDQGILQCPSCTTAVSPLAAGTGSAAVPATSEGSVPGATVTTAIAPLPFSFGVGPPPTAASSAAPPATTPSFFSSNNSSAPPPSGFSFGVPSTSAAPTGGFQFGNAASGNTVSTPNLTSSVFPMAPPPPPPPANTLLSSPSAALSTAVTENVATPSGSMFIFSRSDSAAPFQFGVSESNANASSEPVATSTKFGFGLPQSSEPKRTHDGNGEKSGNDGSKRGSHLNDDHPSESSAQEEKRSFQFSSKSAQIPILKFGSAPASENGTLTTNTTQQPAQVSAFAFGSSSSNQSTNANSALRSQMTSAISSQALFTSNTTAGSSESTAFPNGTPGPSSASSFVFGSSTQPPTAPTLQGGATSSSSVQFGQLPSTSVNPFGALGTSFAPDAINASANLFPPLVFGSAPAPGGAVGTVATEGSFPAPAAMPMGIGGSSTTPAGFGTSTMSSDGLQSSTGTTGGFGSSSGAISGFNSNSGAFGSSGSFGSSAAGMTRGFGSSSTAPGGFGGPNGGNISFGLSSMAAIPAAEPNFGQSTFNVPGAPAFGASIPGQAPLGTGNFHVPSFSQPSADGGFGSTLPMQSNFEAGGNNIAPGGVGGAPGGFQMGTTRGRRKIIRARRP